jgi:hypothetical protein
MIAKIPSPEYWVKGGLLEKRIVSTDIWQVMNISTRIRPLICRHIHRLLDTLQKHPASKLLPFIRFARLRMRLPHTRPRSLHLPMPSSRHSHRPPPPRRRLHPRAALFAAHRRARVP